MGQELKRNNTREPKGRARKKAHAIRPGETHPGLSAGVVNGGSLRPFAEVSIKTASRLARVSSFLALTTHHVAVRR